MEEDIEIEDVEDALKRADELSELTGRKKTDIVADLLDDGKLNKSAGADADTKKDILDVAQEKAEKLKSLLTTLIPIILLLGGVGAEGLGVMDMTRWGEDSVWGEDTPSIMWGCMDNNALNYDEDANEDNGLCEYQAEPCTDEDSDGICDDNEIEGCTDESALNYDVEATDDDNSCTYPPPRCEIVLYDILMQYNNTSASVMYDLDCGTSSNEQEGFNVSVQFWATDVNTTNTTNYTIDFHYIQGYVEDIKELVLTNLTAQMYDFHWIAIWENDEGEDKNLIESWSNIEIVGSENS